MYLLTGSSGYIGEAIQPLICDGQKSVLGLDRIPAGSSKFDGNICCDLLDSDYYDKRLVEVDCVLHLAAAKGDWGISEEEYHRDNFQATRTLLSAGRKAGIKKWLFYSTVSVLGPSKIPVSESAEPSPMNPYGSSKLACEELFQEFAMQDSEAQIIVVRPSAVFGPGNPWNTNIYRLIDNIYRNRFVMVGDGNVFKTTSFIDNLLAATLFLLERFRPGIQIFHYVDQPFMSMEDMVTELCTLLDHRRSKLRVPLRAARALAKIVDHAAKWTGIDLPITSARIEKFCTDTVFSSEKIRDMGFMQPTNNEEALSKTVTWYLDNIAKSN